MRLWAVIAFLVLASCGSGPLSLLNGGGPNVAANVQAGKTNSQTVGITKNTSQKLVRPQARNIEQSTGTTKVRTESAGGITVNEKDSPWLVITIALVSAFAAAGWIHGWLTPSPRERKLQRKLHSLEGA